MKRVFEWLFASDLYPRLRSEKEFLRRVNELHELLERTVNEIPERTRIETIVGGIDVDTVKEYAQLFNLKLYGPVLDHPYFHVFDCGEGYRIEIRSCFLEVKVEWVKKGAEDGQR